MDEDEARAEGTGVRARAVPSVEPARAGESVRGGQTSGGGHQGVVAPRDLGMATAEYAVATLAAVGFAGLLFAVLRSGEVQELLLDLVRRALSTV